MLEAIDELERIIHGVQALRRRTERLDSPFQGATGVAAQFYVHQLQTVLRILRDIRVHHLIADEVGLGKTVQSLMILNALRLQYGSEFRTTVIVPREEQARQWHEEIKTRAHVLGELEGEGENASVRVLWAARIQSPLEQLHPNHCDLIVVDEIQSLRAEIVDAVVRYSNDYSHLLVLTATPDLSSDSRVCELMKLLEPDRVALALAELGSEDNADGLVENQEDEYFVIPVFDEAAGHTILQYLRNCYESACNDEAGWLDLAGMPLHELQPFYAKAWYPYRRLVRSQRRHFPRSLPERIVKKLVANPTEAEVRRIRIVNSYLRSGIDFGKVDRHILAQRALIGGEPLRERVQELMRRGLDPAEALGEVPDLCAPNEGNSRLEELIDWLREFWENDPNRKVLVTAASNRTIQFLERQIRLFLPLVGSSVNRTALEIVLLEAENDDKDRTMLDAYYKSKTKSFTTGDSQLAIVHNHYSEGYNFQCADAIVFYQVPWNPGDVDQWIGRVDRLGRDVIKEESQQQNTNRASRDRPKSVTVVAIGLQGEFDEELIEMYDRTGVLESPRVYEPESIRVLSELLLSAGIRENFSAFSEAEQTLKLGRDSFASGVLDQPTAFGTVELAIESFLGFVKSDAMEPVIPEHKFGAFNNTLGRSRGAFEAAVNRWLWLLVNQNYYVAYSKEKGDKKFYVFDNKKREIAWIPMLDSLFRADNPSIPMFVCRKHLQVPPRNGVRYEWSGVERVKTLRFFDHGCDLHEALLDHWIPLGGLTVTERIADEDTNDLPRQGLSHLLNLRSDIKLWSFKLHLTREHIAFESRLTAGIYLIATGTHDLTKHFNNDGPSAAALLVGLEEDVNDTQAASRMREISRHRAGLMADSRYVRSMFGVCLPQVAVNPNGDDLSELASELVTFVWKDDTRPFCEWVVRPAELCSRLQEHLLMLLRKRVAELRQSQIAPLRAAVHERVLLIQVEENERLQHLDLQIQKIEKRIAEYEEFDSPRNRDVITRNLAPRKRLLEEKRELCSRSREIRVAQLMRCIEEAENPSVVLYVCLDLTIPQIIEPASVDVSSTQVVQ